MLRSACVHQASCASVERVGFVEHDGGAGQQIEERVALAPATGAYSSHPGKHAHAGVRDGFCSISSSSPARRCAGEPRIDGGQRLFFHRSFGQRQAARLRRSAAAERWVAGSNLRIDSTSSPKSSMRTGRSDSGG